MRTDCGQSGERWLASRVVQAIKIKRVSLAIYALLKGEGKEIERETERKKPGMRQREREEPWMTCKERSLRVETN